MTDAALETELDRLFQLPPEQLVAARNALADRLRKAGDRATAARVKRVKRPTPAAWALNQVHFREPLLLEAARAQAQRLRELHAQDGVDPVQLSAAVDAQRGATQAVVDAAARCYESAGLAVGPTQQRRLFTCVQGLFSGRAAELPGRLTEDIEAGGFDALESVGQVLPRTPPPPTAASVAPVPVPASDRRVPDPRLEQARARLIVAEQKARAAAEQVRSCVAARSRSQLELERAQASVREAEAVLTQQRTRLNEHERVFSNAQHALDAAQAAKTEAETMLTQARATLSQR